MKKAVLFRCPYPYGKSQTWLPTDLLKIAASFEVSGAPTDVVDLNLQPLPPLDEYDHVGISVFGMPYIPGSRRLAQQIHETTGKKPMIGGPIIKNFTSEEFQSLYPNSIQVSGEIAEDKKNKDTGKIYRWNNPTLEQVLGIQPKLISEVTLAMRIKGMQKDLLKTYLQNDLGFFVSQGCKHKCAFCGAPNIGKPEKFSGVMGHDLVALCESAKDFGIPRINLYLSSLDLFQNPPQFAEVLHMFAHARQEYGLDIRLRGLSRIDSFLNSLEQIPAFYKLIPASNLHTVGFGVDGTTLKIWKEQNKKNTSLEDVVRMLKICKEVGITPETLMITGFHHRESRKDFGKGKYNYRGNREELKRVVDYSIDWAEKYGAVCRPHVAKECSPGNRGWNSPKWAHVRARLIENPELFKNLDYLALASELSHPDHGYRAQVNAAYMTIIDILGPRGLCATTPLIPYKDGKGMFDKEWNAAADRFNSLVPFDR